MFKHGTTKQTPHSSNETQLYTHNPLYRTVTHNAVPLPEPISVLHYSVNRQSSSLLSILFPHSTLRCTCFEVIQTVVRHKIHNEAFQESWTRVPYCECCVSVVSGIGCSWETAGCLHLECRMRLVYTFLTASSCLSGSAWVASLLDYFSGRCIPPPSQSVHLALELGAYKDLNLSGCGIADFLRHTCSNVKTFKLFSNTARGFPLTFLMLW